MVINLHVITEINVSSSMKADMSALLPVKKVYQIRNCMMLYIYADDKATDGFITQH